MFFFKVIEGDPLVTCPASLSVNKHRIVISRDIAAEHLESHQPASHSFLFLFQQCIAPDEFSFFEFDDPSESGFEQRGRAVHIVSIQKHASFEPKGIPGAESGR